MLISFLLFCYHWRWIKILVILQSEVEDLQRQLVEKMKRINSLEDNELAMQEQMRAFHEDFESERRDREHAQSRIAALESELTAVKQQVRDTIHSLK